MTGAKTVEMHMTSIETRHRGVFVPTSLTLLLCGAFQLLVKGSEMLKFRESTLLRNFIFAN